MKLLKLLSFSLITVLFVGLITACNQPASVLDELNEDVENTDTIDVDMDNGDVADTANDDLSFNPDVVPEMSNGTLVPTGFGATSAVLISTMLGSLAAVRRRK